MAIDRSGKWWKGEDHRDIANWLRAYTSERYQVAQVKRCVCACGGLRFHLHADPDECCVQRTCVACKGKHLVCDSEEFWEEAEPERVRCPCGASVYEVSVGFAFRDDGEVRWISVGHRCVKCGVLASCADWKVDYAPTRHLLKAA